MSKTYNVNGKYITIDNINAFKCDKCEEIVFDGEEVKRLEEYIENNLYRTPLLKRTEQQPPLLQVCLQECIPRI